MTSRRLPSLREKLRFHREVEEYVERNRQIDEPYDVTAHGEIYTILPGVFAPDLYEDTYFFMKALEVRPGETLLEVGAGSGLVSLHAARNGAGAVTATDINPRAVNNIRLNANRLGLASRVTVLHGDVFDPLPSRARFDVIFWNAPFIYRRQPPRDDLDRSVFDQGYQGLTQYVLGGSRHLKLGGRLTLGFSPTSGHMLAVEELAGAAGLSIEVTSSFTFDDGFVVQLLELAPRGSTSAHPA